VLADFVLVEAFADPHADLAAAGERAVLDAIKGEGPPGLASYQFRSILSLSYHYFVILIEKNDRIMIE
jgi:hypothetical protein